MGYQFANHISFELLISISSPKVYQRPYCSRIIKNIFMICQMRESKAETANTLRSRPLPYLGDDQGESSSSSHQLLSNETSPYETRNEQSNRGVAMQISIWIVYHPLKENLSFIKTNQFGLIHNGYLTQTRQEESTVCSPTEVAQYIAQVSIYNT